MRFPIQFPLILEEAQILEVSLRDLEHGINIRRPLLLELGRILLDKEPGTITLLDNSDIWFLRDNIDPNAAFGEVSGLDLITRLYGLLVGYKFELPPMQEENNADENKAEDTNEDETEGRPKSKAKSRQIMSESKGEDSQGNIDAQKS